MGIMKMLAITLILLASSAIVNSQAPMCRDVFRCSPVDVVTKFSKNQCVYVEELKLVNYHEIKPIQCGWGETCPRTTIGNVFCQKNKTGGPYIDGHLCKKDTDCYSLKCHLLTCKGKETNDRCLKSQECKKGFFCNVRANPATCVLQKNIGEDCSIDYDCVNFAGCNQQTKKCVGYYSLEDGKKSSSPMFCQSNDYDKQTYTCLTKTLLSSDLCAAGVTTCEYSAPALPSKKITKDCQCSYQYSDKKFCPMGSNTKEWTDMVKKLKDYYNSKSTKETHTVQRSEEMNSNRDYTYGIAKTFNYPQFKDTDSCAMKLFNSSTKAKISFVALVFTIFFAFWL